MTDNLAYGKVKKTPIIEEYPHNLLSAIRGRSRIKMPVALTQDVEAGIQYALSTLEEQEQALLWLRYAQRKPLPEAAACLAVSEEQAQKAEAKALGKLRLPGRWKYIQHGVANYMRIRIAEEHSRARQAGYWEGYQKGMADARAGVAESDGDPRFLDMPIEVLHLSARTYHCLLLAKCTRIRDVASLSKSDMLRFRNMGEKSAEEVINALQSYGITRPGWKP